MKIYAYALLCAAALTSPSQAQKLNGDAEILSSFSSIVDKCRAALSRPHVYEQTEHSRWGKQVFSNIEVTYDVERTNSLVSPYTGKIITKYITAAGHAPTKDEAEALEIDAKGRAISQNDVFTFSFQNGQWRVVSAEISTSFRLGANQGFDRPMKTSMNRDQLTNGGGTRRECVL